jgi:hypothetical protein
MKTFRPLIMIVLAAALAGAAVAQDLVWQISYAKSGLLADVRLNGYPVFRPADTKDTSGALMIAPWLKPGRNELTVILTPKPGTDASDGQRSFSFSLFTMKRSDPGGSRNEIFRLKLPLKWTDELALPRTLEYSIYLESVPAVRLWDSAEALGPEATAEARDLMARLFGALGQKDADAYFELFRWALEDTYTAHGWNDAGYADKVKAALPGIFASPDFQFAEPDPALLEYTVLPGSLGRLMAVGGADGAPVIKAGAFSQDTLYLARIGGVLTIVRN